MAGTPDHYTPEDVAHWEIARIDYEMGDLTETQWRRTAMRVDTLAGYRERGRRAHEARLARYVAEMGR